MNSSDIKTHILTHLIYSEVFLHPLNKDELCQKVGNNTSIEEALQELESTGLIHSANGFYYINEDNGKVKRRVSGSQLAHKLFPKAYRKAALISKFPYVQGVGISGSLSKGVLHDKADFDFFIITEPNRLWIARTLLILYKKVFLLNSRKYFCVNYFIDSENLEIEEKNLFTAVEISTMILAEGNVMKEFEAKNAWTNSIIHNPTKEIVGKREIKKPILTKWTMHLLKGKFGDYIDEKCLLLTLNKWRKKFKQFDSNTFDLTMKSRKYVSKHHPRDFQNNILKKFNLVKTEYKIVHSRELEKQMIEL